MALSRTKQPWLKTKRVRRDYSRKSFTNPLFRSGQAIGRRWRGLLTGIGALAAFGGWIWFAAFSPAFTLDDIRITGAQNVATWEIRDEVQSVLKRHRWFVLPQKSILIVGEKDIEDALNDRFFFETLTVTKRPPHTLDITLKERVSAVLIAMPGGNQGLIGLDGMVTKLYPAGEALDVVPKLGPLIAAPTAPKVPTGYSVVFDDRDEKLELRQKAVRPEVVQAAIDLPKAFAAAFGKAPTVSQVRLDGLQAQNLRLVTSEGWSIMLNADDDLKSQLGNAQLVLKAKVGPDHRNVEYVDVRFGEKIFLKCKDDTMCDMTKGAKT